MKFGKLFALCVLLLGFTGVGDSWADCVASSRSLIDCGSGTCAQGCNYDVATAVKKWVICEEPYSIKSTAGAYWNTKVGYRCLYNSPQASIWGYCCTSQEAADSLKIAQDSIVCSNNGKVWQNLTCYTKKEACELNGGNWLNDECVADENFSACISPRDLCKSKNGVFSALTIIDNVCSYECEIEVEKNTLGLKYDNSKYYISDNKTSTPTYFEIDKTIFDYVETEMKTCKENSIKLFHGILNGGYIYWKSNESEPSGVSNKIILK